MIHFGHERRNRAYARAATRRLAVDPVGLLRRSCYKTPCSELRITQLPNLVIAFHFGHFLQNTNSAMNAGPFRSSHDPALPRYCEFSSVLQDSMILQDFELVDHMAGTAGLAHHSSGDSKFSSAFDDCSCPLTLPYNETPFKGSSNTTEAFFDVELGDQSVDSLGLPSTSGSDWSLDGWSLFGTADGSGFSDEHTVRQTACSGFPCQDSSVVSNGALEVEQAKGLMCGAASLEESTIKPSHKCSVPGCGRESKPFERKDQLKRHLREVHGEAKFVCGSCGKKFTRRYDFRHHLEKGSSMQECSRRSGRYGTRATTKLPGRELTDQL